MYFIAMQETDDVFMEDTEVIRYSAVIVVLGSTWHAELKQMDTFDKTFTCNITALDQIYSYHKKCYLKYIRYPKHCKSQRFL